MGWICRRCGSENDFDTRECLACHLAEGRQYLILERVASMRELRYPWYGDAAVDQRAARRSQKLGKWTKVVGLACQALAICILLGALTYSIANKPFRPHTLNALNRTNHERLQEMRQDGADRARYGSANAGSLGAASSEAFRAVASNAHAFGQWTAVADGASGPRLAMLTGTLRAKRAVSIQPPPGAAFLWTTDALAEARRQNRLKWRQTVILFSLRAETSAALDLPEADSINRLELGELGVNLRANLSERGKGLKGWVQQTVEHLRKR
jgi:hypothetical protein